MNNKFYPMNSAEVLDRVLDIYKRSFWQQIGLSIIFNIMFMAAMYILLFVGLIATVVAVGAAFAPGSAGTMSAGGVVFIGVLIILFLFSISAYTALLSTGNALITKHTFLGDRCDVGKVIKESFKKIWVATSAVLANVIVMIPGIIVLSVFVYLYIFFIGAVIDGGGIGYWPIVIVSILFILLVIGFFVAFTTITMLSMPAAIFEGKWFFAAFKRGFSLAQYDFVKLMGVVTIWILAVYALSYSIEMIFGIGSAMMMAFAPAESAMFMYFGMMGVRFILTMVVSVIVAPLSGIFYTMIYINQRFKHEGLDVELNLNALRRING